jgi:4-alpha-glucanotransferase
MPERVWEQSLAADLAVAGMKYTRARRLPLQKRGMIDEQLYGYYVTEDDGRTLAIFPAASGCGIRFRFRAAPRRSTTCAASPSSIRFGCRVSATTAKSSAPGPRPKSTCTTTAGCGGSSTSAERDWIKLTTLAEAVENVPPQGKIYLPDCSVPRDDRVGAAGESAARVRAARITR